MCIIRCTNVYIVMLKNCDCAKFILIDATICTNVKLEGCILPSLKGKGVTPPNFPIHIFSVVS